MSGSHSVEVRFPEYRTYSASREEANSAMVALLAGSEIAQHTLRLTAGSDRLLPEIFPGVQHINWFNLKTEKATEILSRTGHHLGTVTITYALALHEDFATSVIGRLGELDVRIALPEGTRDLKAHNAHEALQLTLGADMDADGQVALEHFHVLREMRNCQVHNGGRSNERLRRQLAGLTRPAVARWTELMRRCPEPIAVGTPLEFSIFEIFGVFATTKALARSVNRLMAAELPSMLWAKVAVEDYADLSTRQRGTLAWARGLAGHSRSSYGATALTLGETLATAVEAGYIPVDVAQQLDPGS